MSAVNDGTVPFRLIPHELVDALAEAAGIPITSVMSALIEPMSVTFTALIKDSDGKARIAGGEPAVMTARYPLTSWDGGQA